MLNGEFIDNTPLIKIPVAWGQSIQAPFFILDTGFTGDLQVSPKIANELRLQTIAVTPVGLADGRTVQTPVALAFSVMEGVLKHVEVLISDGMPLVGISFLSKFDYKASVDCKYKIITLKKMI